MAIDTNTIEALQPGERKLYEIRRDVMGLALVYFEVALGFGAAVILMIFLTPIVTSSSTTNGQAQRYLAVGILCVALITWLALSVFTYIYRQSKLIITDRNLTQVIQRGLFSRQVSELSMADVEDVSANQHGVLPSIFDYGDLEVQTAGAADNFIFSFCPKPNFYGKVVLDARQQYLKSSPGQTE